MGGLNLGSDAGQAHKDCRRLSKRLQLVVECDERRRMRENDDQLREFYSATSSARANETRVYETKSSARVIKDQKSKTA